MTLHVLRVQPSSRLERLESPQQQYNERDLHHFNTPSNQEQTFKSHLEATLGKSVYDNSKPDITAMQIIACEQTLRVHRLAIECVRVPVRPSKLDPIWFTQEILYLSSANTAGSAKAQFAMLSGWKAIALQFPSKRQTSRIDSSFIFLYRALIADTFHHSFYFLHPCNPHFLLSFCISWSIQIIYFWFLREHSIDHHTRVVPVESIVQG